MRILITGAKGFLGKRLVKYYQEKYEVYAATHENMDFTDIGKIQDVFSCFRPEIVIHCGAISDVGQCSQNPQKSLEINVYGTQNIAKVCSGFGAKMIFCSSDQVYIEPFTEENQAVFFLPHREEEKTKPLPVYGQHKLLAEQHCIHENPDSVILRLTLMYDVPDEADRENARGMFGENLKMVLKGRQRQQFCKNTSRGITDCREVVANMEKAWELPAGIYNFGSPNRGNLYDTVRAVFALLGKEELAGSSEGGNIRNLLIDTQKIESAGIAFRDTVAGLYDYIISY